VNSIGASRGFLALKNCQVIGRGLRTWIVRGYTGRDTETKKKYLNNAIHDRLRDAQAKPQQDAQSAGLRSEHRFLEADA
jgi:hypothetical protein